MTDDEMMKKLLSMDATRRRTIIEEASGAYMRDLSNIAADIYDSCIEDYYAQYEPIKYTRHGNKKGFNLYRANNVNYDETTYNLDIDFDPNKLLRYYDGKRNREKRDKVLKTVMAGLRGAGSSKSPPDWPQEWFTSYPNEYSSYSIWYSRGGTMNAIFENFMNNVMHDTTHLFYNYIKKFL